MKRLSLKQLLAGGIIISLSVVSIFGTSSIPQYKTTTLQSAVVKKEVDFTSYWYPQGYAKVAVGSSSLDVKHVKVKEGDSVDKGEVLVQLVDDTEYNQYKAAQASYYAAIKAKKNAEATPMTPQSTIDTLQGQINSAYYQVKNAEVNLNRKKVKSPITGKVVEIDITDYSTTTTSALSASVSTLGNYIVIANVKDASFTATVGERDVAKLKTGMEVSITTRVSENVYRAKIVKISKSPVTSTTADAEYQIVVKFDTYPSELAYGTKLEGAIITANKEGASAVQYDALTIDSATTGSVLILNNDQVTPRNVTIGVVGDDSVEVLSGINENEQIVIDQLPDKKVITVRPWLKKLFGSK